MRRRRGVKGAAAYVPWALDGAPLAEQRQFLAALPVPVRLINRLVWDRGTKSRAGGKSELKPARAYPASNHVLKDRKANTMKLTIFGANGKTGTRLAVPPHSDLLVVTADVMGLVAIAPAVSGRGHRSVSCRPSRPGRDHHPVGQYPQHHRADEEVRGQPAGDGLGVDGRRHRRWVFLAPRG